MAAVHGNLVGLTELIFIDTNDLTVDAVLLCMGHGHSASWMEAHRPPEDLLVVDLSTDFRDSDQWTYGLPELHRDEITTANRIANPGCFATAIQLALLPLAAAGLAEGEIHVHGITGSTGAGQRPTATTHFSWRNNNVSVYKAFDHQHLTEIHRSLGRAGRQKGGRLNFLPVRGPFARGIFVTAYLDADVSEAEARSIFEEYYREARFTHVASEPLHLKQVVNTNRALVHVAKHDSNLLVTSVIDNLLKGASGQAVQNMNLALGLPEGTGLNLKASAF